MMPLILFKHPMRAHILVEELLADHEPASSKYVDVANAVMYINMYTYVHVGPNYLYMHLLTRVELG